MTNKHLSRALATFSKHGGSCLVECNPEGCSTILQAAGGVPHAPSLTQTQWVGGSACQPPGSPGGGGGASYIPQNDPHEALINLGIHKWGKIFCKKKNAHELKLPSAKV